MAHSDKRAILLKALALAAAGAVIWAPTAYADDPANPDETQQNEDEQDKRDDAADQAQSAIDQAKDAVDQANQAAQQNQQSEHDKKFGATGGLMYLINGVPTCAHAGDSYTNVEVVVMQPITPLLIDRHDRGPCRPPVVLHCSVDPARRPSCELPQGRKAARVNGLWRVRGVPYPF